MLGNGATICGGDQGSAPKGNYGRVLQTPTQALEQSRLGLLKVLLPLVVDESGDGAHGITLDKLVEIEERPFQSLCQEFPNRCFSRTGETGKEDMNRAILHRPSLHNYGCGQPNTAS